MKKKRFLYFLLVRIFAWFFLLSCFSFPNLFAQSPSENSSASFLENSFTVDEVVVEGNVSFSQKKILSLFGIKAGQVVDAKDIRKGFGRLFETGAFADISIEIDDSFDRRRLIIKVSDNFRVGDVTFAGNDFFNGFSLKREAKISKYFERANVDNAVSRILEKYYKEGFIDIVVTYETKKNKKGRMDIQFFITEGNRYIVKNINFFGNENIKKSKLLGKMQQKKKGFLRKANYERVKIEGDPSNLEFFYKTRGYIDVKVSDPKYSFEWKDPSKRQDVYMTADFTIEEGEKFFFGGYELRGNRLFSTKRLTKGFRRKEGNVYNEAIHLADFANIVERYHENGHIFARVTPIRTVDRENKTVSYVFDIYEGEVAHVEKIFIQGLTKTKDYIVRKELSLEEGEIFSSIALRESLLRINRLQFFSSVTPGFRSGTTEGLLNLSFTVKEQLTAILSGGFTYSASSGFALTGEFTEKNFLGRGQTLSIKGSYGLNDKSMTLSFFDPSVLKSFLGMGGSFTVSKNYNRHYIDQGNNDVQAPDGGARGIVNNRKNSIDYTRDRFFVNFFLSETFLTWYTLSQNIFFEYNRDYLDSNKWWPENYTQRELYEANSSLFSRPPPSDTIFAYGFGLGLSRDTRDSKLNPTQGSYVNLFSSFYFGGYSLTKWGAKFSTFFSFFKAPFPQLRSSSSIVLGYSFEVDSLAHSILGDFNYPAQLFYGFNSLSLRGWDYSLVYNFRANRFGNGGLVENYPFGQARVKHTFEFYIPFPVDLFQFVTFLDMGNLSVEKIDFKPENMSFLVDFKNMLYGTGFGFRLNLPQLPIRLYLSWRLTYDVNGKNFMLFQHPLNEKTGVYEPAFSLDFQRSF